MSEDIQRVTKGCKVCEMGQLRGRKKGCLMEYLPSCGERWEWIYFTAKEETTSSLWIICQITELQQIKSLAVIAAMKQQFRRHGIPVVVQTDGVPQFVSEEF